MSTSKTPAKKAPKGRGGKRKGAGRPAAHGQAGVTSGITMPPAYWEMLDAQCGSVGRSGWIMGLILKADIRSPKAPVTAQRAPTPAAAGTPPGSAGKPHARRKPEA